MKPTNDPDVTDSPEGIARGSLQQHGSAASSQTCDFCGGPATKLVKRIITNRTWPACDACCEKRRMSRGPYMVTTLPNNALTESHEIEAQKKLS